MLGVGHPQQPVDGARIEAGGANLAHTDLERVRCRGAGCDAL